MIRCTVRNIVAYGCLIIWGIIAIAVIPALSWAASEPVGGKDIAPSGESSEQPIPWYKNIDAEWGGHVKIRGAVSWPDDESYFKYVGTGSYYDGSTELRIKNKVFLGSWGDCVTHYEAVYSGGDTRRKEKSLERLYPGLFGGIVRAGDPPDDSRRLMDLTHTIDEDDNSILYHRLDRLYMTVNGKWGSVRMGRQAITWGNGLSFNPMDLFNPFAPTDIEREYKTGDDMIALQSVSVMPGELQLLGVPRRDQESGDVAWSQSSLAGKYHHAYGSTEIDVMAAKHYRDAVVGLGGTGYIGSAAWRCDGTWTFLDKQGTANDYLSLVANIDYSWVWLTKNCYGYIEYYFNGLCHADYSDAVNDPVIQDRIDRGELYTLGRHYVSAHLKVELHPLFNISVTVINNMEDPSGSIQPRGIWDVTQNIQLTIGGTWYYGSRDTEFGGFKVAGTDFYSVPSNNFFLWLAYYF